MADAPKGWDDGKPMPITPPAGWDEGEPISTEKMGAPEAYVHGGVEAVPLGQKIAALGTSGALKLAQMLGSSPYLKNLDTSYAGQLARERGNLTRAEADQPWATTAGKMTGGAASMAALAPFAGASIPGRIKRSHRGRASGHLACR